MLSTPTGNFLPRANALLDRGFSVIPISPQAKNTIPGGPGATSRTLNLDVIKVWAAEWPNANVAVCADDNVTILESDDAPRFRAILAGLGITLPETLTGGASENRPHWFYKRTAACGDDCLEVPGLFEFRNHNQYVVGPGSIHPSGAEYRFWNDAPIVELPDAVLDVLRELDASYRGEAKSEHIQPGPYTALRNAYLRRLDPQDMLALECLEISEGERHYTLMSLAGLLHDGERTEEDLAEILCDVRDHHFLGATDKGNDEIARIAHDILRREPCELEPHDLPSYSVGLVIFRTAEAMEKWLTDNADDFAVGWELLDSEDVPEQRVLVTLNGEPMIRQETVSEVVAFRGLGKSMFIGSLIKILTKGGEFLGLQSSGGNRVLLVDGELPKKLLQTRLRRLVGKGTGGLFRVRSLAQAKGSCMPALADPAIQETFVARLKGWRPDVIIFDTRTAVFKHDTNDAEQLLQVNEFLIRLRAEGFVVILTHHAGKNGTQRGRTDNDDITDLIIQLRARKGWTPGDGLEFALGFEKVRYGDRLEGFDAKWTQSAGWERLQTTDSEVIATLLEGKSINAAAIEFGMGNAKIADIKRRAEANGVEFPKLKSGPKVTG